MENKNIRHRVLDKGYVELIDSMGDDQRIVNSARVSYAEGTKTVRDNEGLIDYLMRHGHTSPFEKVVFEFLVSAPLYVVAQWVRHRTGSFNFRSYRYSQAPDEFQHIDRLRAQNPHNRQGSFKYVEYEDEDTFRQYMNLVEDEAYHAYKNAIASGAAREQARIILPQTLYTQFCWTVNLHNLLHFLLLRMDSHAQEEIRDYANVIYSIVDKIVPLTVKSWENNVYGAITFTKAEQVALNSMINSGLGTRAVIGGVREGDWGLSGTKYWEFRAKLDKCAESAQKYAETLGKQLIMELSTMKGEEIALETPNPDDKPQDTD